MPDFCLYEDYEKVDRVWIKRMLPCVRVLQKSRKANDYIRVFKALKAATRMNQIRLPPEKAMVYFEIAAKIAFEFIYKYKIKRQRIC